MKLHYFVLSIIFLAIISSCSKNVTPPTIETDTTLKPSPPQFKAIIPQTSATPKPTIVLPTVTLTPSSTPDYRRLAQQAALLYSQDFESGAPYGLQFFNQERWNVLLDPSGNHIFCNEDSSDWITVHFGTDLWTNYAVEFRVKSETINSIFQIFARINSRTEGYDGSLIYQYSNADLSFSPSNQHLGQYPFYAQVNTWYLLRMEVVGNTIKFFIDDDPVVIANDNQRSQGKAGFGASPHSMVCVDDIRVWELDQSGHVAQVPTRTENLQLSISERLNSHKFPKLFYLNQDSDPIADALVQSSYRDIIILDPEVVNSEWLFLGPAGIIHTKNPNAIILTQKSVQEYFPDDNTVVGSGIISQMKPDWVMKDIYGKPYPIFCYGDGHWSIMLNLSTDISTFIPDYINDTVMKTGLFDGIYYDGVNESWWQSTRTDNPPAGPIDSNNDGKADSVSQLNSAMDNGLQRLLKETRTVFPAGSVITGNGGWDGGLLVDKNLKSDTILANLLNGRMIEGFLNWENNGIDWLMSMRAYYLMQQASSDPKTPLIMAYCTGTDYSHLRYVLTSTLLFDGYFDCTNSQTPGGQITPYAATWWYDEYAVDLSTGKAVQSLEAKGYLGLPLSNAYNIDNKNELLGTFLVNDDANAKKLVWRRDFQNGIVIVNPSSITRTIYLDGTYKKILGDHDPIFNDGSRINGITLNPQSGIILLNIPQK